MYDEELTPRGQHKSTKKRTKSMSSVAVDVESQAAKSRAFFGEIMGL